MEKYDDRKKSAAPMLVLAGLWAINLLIVAFGWPFLVLKKIQDWRGVSSFDFGEGAPAKQKKSSLFPCRG